MASEETKKKAAIAGFAVVMVGVLGYNLWGFISPPPPPPQVAPVIIDKSAPGSRSTTSASSAAPIAYPAAGGKTVTPISSNGQLDPTLHMEGMLAAESLVYTGTGRNIFASSAQQEVNNQVALNVKPKFPARPNPTPPAPVTPSGPPRPAPVNLKFFGTATQDGVRKALLLGGDDVFLASTGDIVQRRYKIINIAANSIVVEDMPNTNQQTLPLLVNP